jgi:uncharacterized membrane protein YkvA (DUF1232 family)
MGFPKGFKRAVTAAKLILKNKDKLKKLLTHSEGKSAGEKVKEKMKGVWEELQTFLRLLKAYYQGQYTSIPWKSLVYLTAAIVYFASPIDIIPDFLPAIGLMDDVSIIAFVVKQISDDLDDFKSWESAHAS